MVGLLLMLAWYHPAPFIAFLGLAGLSDWFGFLSRLGPREQALAKAAHGVGVIVCGAYIVYNLPLSPWYEAAIRYVYSALCLLGVIWLFIGSARAQIYSDAALTIRAIAKFAVGWGVWFLWGYLAAGPLPLENFLPGDQIVGAFLRAIFRYNLHLDLRIFIEPLVTLVSLWCWSTSFVQFLICSRRFPRLPRGDNPGSHGTSDFGRGGKLGDRSAAQPAINLRPARASARPRNPPTRRRG
jgi:hypothetical protein